MLRTIENPTPDTDDRFGYSVACLRSSRVAVGAPWDDRGARDAGVVYIFSSNTGRRLRTIENPDPDIGDKFGVALAHVFPNMVLVGTTANIAYLFNYRTGALVQTLNAPAGAQGFGTAVAGNNYAIVGAKDTDNAGVVYVFDPETGDVTLTLENPNPDSGDGGADQFGGAVAPLLGDIIVGAAGEDAGARDAGAVYFFDGRNGELKRTFLNPDPDDDDIFGSAVFSAGLYYVIVGAPYDDTAASNAGAVYLFSSLTGELLNTFFDPDPRAGEWFGQALSAWSGPGEFIVGTWVGDHPDKNGAGIAYLFKVSDGPEMTINTGDYVIVDGDASPRTSDGTSFGNIRVGSIKTNYFTIRNFGIETLNLSGNPRVQIIGKGMSAFSVSRMPDDSVSPFGNSTRFGLRFNPVKTGTYRATVRIPNNDDNENPYNFDIVGVGVK